MTNLAIDIGNTLAKAAVSEGGEVVEIFKCEAMTPDYLETTVLKQYPDIGRGILISTRTDDRELEAYLERRLCQYIRFDHTTPIPIRNLYATPETLGRDRLAAAVGAAALRPGQNVLVVDFGTAITFDFVTADGEFEGGNISPGATTRFAALHRFTGRLPLRTLTEETELFGKTSFSAIESGVINGIVYEIEGYIRRLSEKKITFNIIFTGGDGKFFAKRLNYPIFASHDLVVYGLNKILEYNAE